LFHLGERVTLVKDSGQETADRLHSAAVHLLRFVRAADAGMDLDGPRASALSVLVFGGPLPLGRLAEVEQVTPQAITKTVAALSAGGLVRRRRSTRDRRVVFAEATEAGRDLLRRGRDARVRMVADLLAGVPPADLRTLDAAATLVERLLATARAPY
jgi:DNA-binding MarR family transcriptional regulator